MNIKDTIQRSQESLEDIIEFPNGTADGAWRYIGKCKTHLKTAQLQLLQSVLEGIDKEITDYSMVFDLRLEGVLSDLEFLRAKEAYRVLNTIALPIREQINRLTE